MRLIEYIQERDEYRVPRHIGPGEVAHSSGDAG